MVSPLEMPPWMPPLRLVFVRRLPPSSMKNSSLCSLPVSLVPSKPEPSSNALVAGRLSIACAKSASSLWNTGAPRPRGTLRSTHVTTPPQLLPLVRTSSMAAIISSALASSGHRTMFASTSSMVNDSMSTASVSTSRTALTYARTSVPHSSLRIFFAMAPAATRPIVSRALDRPPPAIALTPYFMSYVASACDGRYATATSL
mmetsp:Transcript_15343/g.52410  ORF Transcript_15343/g.52410 Transcript_15343/m.52410 type:complete len:202 (+) Transcript_15343:371-976(+)